MKCPFCNYIDTKVIDSRPSDDNSTIRRRRQCENCNKRFTTYEKVDSTHIVVIKKDDTRELYDRSKIESGVLRACHKRVIPIENINACIEEIEKAIFNTEGREIPSSIIGEIVMEKLKGLDPVAYIRFVSVYKEFKDVNSFMEELKKL